jgi:uridine phosphorylase
MHSMANIGYEHSQILNSESLDRIDKLNEIMKDKKSPPILIDKYYLEASVFTPENLLREAGRQREISHQPVPEVCLLDPDGDIVRYLNAEGRASLHIGWACYHTQLHLVEYNGVSIGILPYAVGASFAVLVAEELFASGCRLLFSMTSSGQLDPIGPTPYFVLIERALRDEGTSYHYLPPGEYSDLQSGLLNTLDGAFQNLHLSVHSGATWTTDAPFRETADTIEIMLKRGLLAVEMEAAALYAFATSREKDVICFAHVTNQMAQIEGDFEKGIADGATDALGVVTCAAHRLGYST